MSPAVSRRVNSQFKSKSEICGKYSYEIHAVYNSKLSVAEWALLGRENPELLMPACKISQS